MALPLSVLLYSSLFVDYSYPPPYYRILQKHDFIYEQAFCSTHCIRLKCSFHSSFSFVVAQKLPIFSLGSGFSFTPWKVWLKSVGLLRYWIIEQIILFSSGFVRAPCSESYRMNKASNINAQARFVCPKSLAASKRQSCDLFSVDRSKDLDIAWREKNLAGG